MTLYVYRGRKTTMQQCNNNASYNLDYSRARAYCTCSRCGWCCLDIFTLIYPFSPLSPSLWETARYRLKYCLKGPLNPKPTNQNLSLSLSLSLYSSIYSNTGYISNSLSLSLALSLSLSLYSSIYSNTGYTSNSHYTKINQTIRSGNQSTNQ